MGVIFILKNMHIHILKLFWSFPGGSAGREFPCNVGDLGSIPGLGRSLEKGTATHSVIPRIFCPGELHGLYSPWGCKESDTTERLSLSLDFQSSPCLTDYI